MICLVCRQDLVQGEKIIKMVSGQVSMADGSRLGAAEIARMIEIEESDEVFEYIFAHKACMYEIVSGWRSEFVSHVSPPEGIDDFLGFFSD